MALLLGDRLEDQKMRDIKPICIKCYGNNVKAITGTLDCGVTYTLKHVDGDPFSVHRFYLTGEKFSLELTPTKGLSINWIA